MKQMIGKGISYFILMVGASYTLMGGEAYAGTMGPVQAADPGKVYGSIFGGAGASLKSRVSQFGTAFFTEAEGGPLAVNAFGRTNSRTVGIIGGNVGYQWGEHHLDLFRSWSITPAVELEGYYLGNSSFKANLNNMTDRLPAHIFRANYPMDTGVFLTNAVLNFNDIMDSRFHPYVGAGIGGAIVSVGGATSLQNVPVEPGLNHYNSNASDSSAAFAAQTKVGLSLDLTQNVSMFAEYRWLFISRTNFSFGSTVAAGHVATSNWDVRLGSQYYNLGSVGIRYSV